MISFYMWDYSCMGQTQQVFYKKCILTFHAMHGHLASIFAYNSKHHVDAVFDHFTTMLVSLLVVSRCKL